MRNIRNIIIWAITAYLGFVVCQISLARIYVASNPDRSLSAFPSYSEALIAQNYEVLVQVKPEGLSSVDKALIKTNTREILSKAPLNDDALLQMALLDFQETREYSKPELLVMAKGRSARNRNTLRHLLGYYLRIGAYEQAVDELDLLMRLNPKNAKRYHDILDDLYKVQEGKTAINEKLKAKTVWSQSFLKRAIRVSTSKQALALSVPVKDQIKDDGDNGDSLVLVDLFLSKLVSTGQIENAYAFWIANYSEQLGDMDPAKAAIFNPLFQEYDVPPPFNWRIYSHAGISTEYDTAGGLFVSFNHTKPRLIARQYAKISNGRQLKITFDARLNYKETEGDFEWRLVCLKSRQKIMTLSVLDADQNPSGKISQNLMFDGSVCPFIDIQLWGVPGVFNDRIYITIETFDVTMLELEGPAKRPVH